MKIYLVFFSNLFSGVYITYCLWDTRFIHTVRVWQVKLIPNVPRKAYWSRDSFQFTTTTIVYRIQCLLCLIVRSGQNWFSKNKWGYGMGNFRLGFVTQFLLNVFCMRWLLSIEIWYRVCLTRINRDISINTPSFHMQSYNFLISRWPPPPP